MSITSKFYNARGAKNFVLLDVLRSPRSVFIIIRSARVHNSQFDVSPFSPVSVENFLESSSLSLFSNYLNLQCSSGVNSVTYSFCTSCLDGPHKSFIVVDLQVYKSLPVHHCW